MGESSTSKLPSDEPRGGPSASKRPSRTGINSNAYHDLTSWFNRDQASLGADFKTPSPSGKGYQATPLVPCTFTNHELQVSWSLRCSVVLNRVQCNGFGNLYRTVPCLRKCANKQVPGRSAGTRTLIVDCVGGSVRGERCRCLEATTWRTYPPKVGP